MTLDELQEKDSRYAGIPKPDLFKYLHETHYSDIPEAEFAKAVGYELPDKGDFVRGFKEPFKQLPQQGYGLIAGGAAAAESAFGEGGLSTGVKKFAVGKYIDETNKLALDAKESDSLTYSLDKAKEGDFGSLVNWVQHGLGYGTGQLVELLATRGIGSAAARLGTPAIAKELTEKMVASQVAKLAATEATKNLGESELRKMAIANVGAKLASIGGNAAMVGSSIGMEGSEIFGGLTQKEQETGKPLTGSDIAKGFVWSVASGLTDFVGDKFGLDVVTGKSPLFKMVGQAAGIKGMIGRGLLAGGIAATAEGSQEYAQTLMEEQGKGNNPFSSQSLKQAFDAAGMGAIAGGGAGVVGGVVSKPTPPVKKVTPPVEILESKSVDEAIQKSQAKLDEPITIQPTVIDSVPMPETDINVHEPATVGYDEIFNQAAVKHNIPVEILKAFNLVEAGGRLTDNGKTIRPLDKNGNKLSDAVGPMQIIGHYFPEFDADKLATDPQYNVKAAAQILQGYYADTDSSLPAIERWKQVAKRYYGSTDDSKNDAYANKIIAAIGQDSGYKEALYQGETLTKEVTNEEQTSTNETNQEAGQERLLDFDYLSSEGIPLKKIGSNLYTDYQGDNVEDDYAEPASQSEVAQAIDEIIARNHEEKQAETQDKETGIRDKLSSIVTDGGLTGIDDGGLTGIDDRGIKEVSVRLPNQDGGIKEPVLSSSKGRLDALKIDSFETEKGSVYKILENGKTQRYKTITKEKLEPQDLMVFAKFKNVQQEQDFLNGVQNREGSGTKVYVIDKEGNKYDTNEQIKDKDVRLALVDTKTNSVIETVETKKEPTIGYNTFDQRRYKENNESYRESHIGNKVTKINQKTAPDSNGKVQIVPTNIEDTTSKAQDKKTGVLKDFNQEELTEIYNRINDKVNPIANNNVHGWAVGRFGRAKMKGISETDFNNAVQSSQEDLVTKPTPAKDVSIKDDNVDTTTPIKESALATKDLSKISKVHTKVSSKGTIQLIDTGTGQEVFQGKSFKNPTEARKYFNSEKEKQKTTQEIEQSEAKPKPEKQDTTDKQKKAADKLRKVAQTTLDAATAKENQETEDNGLKFSKSLPTNNDEEYLDAVKRGDMETAQRMVNKAAEQAGYGLSDYQMQHTAPDKESGTSILNLSEIYPDDFYSSNAVRYYGDGQPQDAEAIHKLQKYRDKKPTSTFMVYRAVPKSLKETAPRNGDWISTTRGYAEQHGRNYLTEGYKVIAYPALAKNVYTDGNSPHELGYDDGRNYVYANTKNNRKLLDAVTYDDNGEVIPLSKRFNKRKDDRRYSKSQQTKGQTIEETIKQLPKKVKAMVDNGKVKVLHNIGEVAPGVLNRSDVLSIGAWHGGADFDQFDLSFVGTGEGTAHFGYGFNFTDLQDFAKNYVRKLGKLYKVDLAPEKADLLDFDKPVSFQSEKVRGILEANGLANNNFIGTRIYKDLVAKLGSDKEASKYLMDLGIRGTMHKLPGQTAYNYVAFSDKDISVVQKFMQGNQGAEGMYDSVDDVIYMFADNLNNDNLQSVLAHELFHRSLATDAKTKAAYEKFTESMQKRFNLASKGIGSKIELSAYKRVITAKTALANQLEEWNAYIISQYQKNPQSLPAKLVKLIKDWYAQIRMALLRSGLDFGMVKNLSPADLAAMATYGTRIIAGNELSANNEVYASTKAERFYSALRRGFLTAPENIFNGSAQHVKAWLSGNMSKIGVRADEIYWTGLNDFLAIKGKEKVSKQDVLDYLDTNSVQIKDVVLGDVDIDEDKLKEFIEENGYIEKEKNDKGFLVWWDLDGGRQIEGNIPSEKEAERILDNYARKEYKKEFSNNPTKYANSNYVVPGGKDAKELVVTIPTVEPYNASDSTHYGDVGTLSGDTLLNGKQIAWIRMDSRTDSEGNDGIFVNEFQSQRGQQGRSKGFGRKEPGKVFSIEHDLFWNIVNEYGDIITKYDDKQQAQEKADDFNKNGLPAFLKDANIGGGVPPAPFVTNVSNKATDAYILLLMKKAISQAVDEGKTFVAWTTGSQQADFYDLSKQIKDITLYGTGDNLQISATSIENHLVIDKQQTTQAGLADIIGKDAANKLLSQPEPDLNNPYAARHLFGEDLKIEAPWTAKMYGDENGLDAQGKPALITQAANDIARKFGGKVGGINIPSEKYRKNYKNRYQIEQFTDNNKWRVFREGTVSDMTMKEIEYADEKIKYFLNTKGEAEALAKELNDRFLGQASITQPALIITPQMRDKILDEGMPLFSKKSNKWTGGDTITIDNKERSTKNSNGKLIADTEEGLRNFWKWFGNSKVVDDEGRPLVVYHGGNGEKTTFSYGAIRGYMGSAYFTDNKKVAWRYALGGGIDKELSLADYRREQLYKLPDRKPFVNHVFLNIKNILDGDNISFDEVRKITGDKKFFDTLEEWASNDYANAEEGFYDEKENNNEHGEYLNFEEYFKDNFEYIIDFEEYFAQEDTEAISGTNDAFKFLVSSGLLSEYQEKGNFDGIKYYDNESESNVFVVDSSNQIKSAIGNTGDFSAESSDIRFSIANDEENLPEETGTDKFQRQYQDKMIRFKVIQQTKEIEAANDGGYTGKDIYEARAYMKAHNIINPVRDDTNVYQAESLRSGIATELIKDFEETVLQPLVKETVASKLTMDDISDFLKMQHVAEANERIRKIKPDQDNPTAYGITDEEAKAYLGEVEQRDDYQKLKDIAEKWRGLTEDILNMKVSNGILPQEQADAYRATFNLYVPVKGAEETPQGTGRGLSVYNQNKRRLGHGLRDERIIENIVKDYESTINLIEKNKVAQIAGNFIKEIDDEEVGTIGKPVRRQVFMPGAMHYMVEYHGSDVQAFDNLHDAQRFVEEESLKVGRNKRDFYIDHTRDDGRVILQVKPLLDDNEFQYYEEGKAIRGQWNDELLARAFKNLGIEPVNKLLEGAREFNTFLSKAYTGWSPTFLIKNPIRDAIQGAITLTSKLGIKETGKIFAAYPHAMTELYKHFKNHGSSSEVNKYRYSGGSTGAAYISDTERLGNDIMDAYNEYAGAVDTYNRTYEQAIADGKSENLAKLKAVMKAGKAGFRETPVLGHFIKFMENANSITENALRLATFNTLIAEKENSKRVYSNAQAALMAKDLMNFNRKGELTTHLGALYLFFNPNAQGTHVLLSALGNAQYKDQARILTGTIVLSAFLAAEAMRGGDDEDKWRRIPANLKDRNLIFGFGDTKFMLPVPYGYGIFHSLGNAISDTIHGQSGWKSGIRLTASLFDNFSPFGNPIDSEHGAYQLLPTIPKMAMATSVNENNFGTPIMPDKWNASKPDSQTMWRNTKGTVYDDVAQLFNNLSGGSKYKAGIVDVSPESLRFWISSLTGGTGQFAMDSINLGSTMLQGSAPELKEIPIVKAFTHEIGVQDARQAFWKAAEEAKTAADEFSAAKKAGDRLAMVDIKKSNGTLINLSKYAIKQQKMIKTLRDAQDSIRISKLPLATKKAKLKELEKREIQVYDRFLNNFYKDNYD